MSAPGLHITAFTLKLFTLAMSGSTWSIHYTDQMHSDIHVYVLYIKLRHVSVLVHHPQLAQSAKCKFNGH